MSINPQVARYRAVVIKHALILYAETGMKANRMYTPTNMLNAAAGITGKTYKRGQYVQAAADIQSVLNGSFEDVPF
jgi:hypothetical protein